VPRPASPVRRPAMRTGAGAGSKGWRMTAKRPVQDCPGPKTAVIRMSPAVAASPVSGSTLARRGRDQRRGQLVGRGWGASGSWSSASSQASSSSASMPCPASISACPCAINSASRRSRSARSTAVSGCEGCRSDVPEVRVMARGSAFRRALPPLRRARDGRRRRRPPARFSGATCTVPVAEGRPTAAVASRRMQARAQRATTPPQDGVLARLATGRHMAPTS